MAEFKTLQFPNNSRGQAEKVRALQRETSQGWHVISETIVPGKFRGGQACCLFLIFAPCAFLAGHTDDIITVTLQRGSPNEAAPTAKYDKAKWTALLQYDAEVAAVANQLRSLDPKWTDELAAAYLTLGEKKYLPDILARIADRARMEREQKEAARVREQERKKAQELERQRIEQARRDRRANFIEKVWGTQQRQLLTVAVCVFVIVLGMSLMGVFSY